MANIFELPKFENEDQNVKARLIFLISVGMAMTTLIFVVLTMFAMPNLLIRAIGLAILIIPETRKRLSSSHCLHPI